ncbi:MAG: hypothetical protein CUN56_00920 [Phototrophicales bacterium]|nr:MAG: hypothetical protein CUN56_00920 [Phototrophicales bacterium]
MSYRVEWLSDKQDKILLEFQYHWNWSSFHAGVSRDHEMIRSVEHDVVLILHPASVFPSNPMPHFWRAFEDQPPNLKKIVVVTPTDGEPILLSFMRRIAKIIAHFFPNSSKVEFVKSVEEAIADVG